MSGSHPAFALFATALVVAVLRGRLQRLALVGGAILAIFAWSRLEPGEDWFWSLRGYQLHLLHVDRLSLVFGLVFSIITLIGIVYALHVRRGSEHAATLAYAGGSLGVVFAGDWLTLFVFWELMAVASLFVIWYGDSEKAGGAGFRYLLVHISGGSLLFAGILVHLSRGGSISLQALTAGDVDALAFWLILLGVAINAAIPPLHAWLTDAYPEASVSGSVFLSVYTTKTAVYVLIRFFPGAEVLVWAGVIMALYGVVFAVLENDIRRLLAYHIVSQVGYMVAGVGMGTELALNGSAAHAFS
ncbi:MAG: proton-conducting transporter membrane subunit, partial [Acidobacteriota bacterium]